ncbi:MAG: hypothetical protein JXA10_03005 [Anaerolineae bacterium]|nr:hypothetical protein [Anaerolineae bacterium]
MQDPSTQIWWMLFIISSAMTGYYGAIVGGVFKDSLMSQFRKYGEENRIYPVVRLLGVAGLTSMILVSLLPHINPAYLRELFPRSIFVLLAFAFWGAALVVLQQPTLRQSFPYWYFELLRTTSRQERRQIGYAWLRIPRLMRLRLNGDQSAFRVWAELVRLTVIYGAHDPDSPWDVWT